MNHQKMYYQIKKVHYYVAMVVKPNWSYRELLTMICERLTNRQLRYIVGNVDSYYKELKPYAFAEMLERKVLNKEGIYEPTEKVEQNYRKALKRYGLPFEKRS